MEHVCDIKAVYNINTTIRYLHLCNSQNGCPQVDDDRSRTTVQNIITYNAGQPLQIKDVHEKKRIHVHVVVVLYYELNYKVGSFYQIHISNVKFTKSSSVSMTSSQLLTVEQYSFILNMKVEFQWSMFMYVLAVQNQPHLLTFQSLYLDSSSMSISTASFVPEQTGNYGNKETPDSSLDWLLEPDYSNA